MRGHMLERVLVFVVPTVLGIGLAWWIGSTVAGIIKALFEAVPAF